VDAAAAGSGGGKEELSAGVEFVFFGAVIAVKGVGANIKCFLKLEFGPPFVSDGLPWGDRSLWFMPENDDSLLDC